MATGVPPTRVTAFTSTEDEIFSERRSPPTEDPPFDRQASALVVDCTAHVVQHTSCCAPTVVVTEIGGE
jgi:hypothetical protein